MATWIIVAGVAVLLLIMAGAVIVVVLSTRPRSGRHLRLPGFKRFDVDGTGEPPTPAS